MSSFYCESDLEFYPEEPLIYETIPAEGISVICGKDGNKNSLVAIELALHVAYGKDLRGRETPFSQQVLYITVDSTNKIVKHIDCWKKQHGICVNSLFSIISEPIDFMNKDHLNQLVADIKFCNLSKGIIEYPPLIVIEIQGGLTDEFRSNKLINSIDYLRRQMKAAVLLVFNEGSCEGSCEQGIAFRNIFNAADAVHRVTSPSSDDLRVRLSCIKMKDSAKPTFVALDLACVTYQQYRGVANEI